MTRAIAEDMKGGVVTESHSEACQRISDERAERLDQYRVEVDSLRAELAAMREERDVALDREAQLREALEKAVQRLKDQSFSVYGKTISGEPPCLTMEWFLAITSALTTQPGEWLKEQLRLAKIDALTCLPCNGPLIIGVMCCTVDPKCCRCKALDELRGGRG